jgi:hypothetical protein
MIRLSGKSRRVLRAVYRGLGAGVAALTLNACDWDFETIEIPAMYGPGPDRPPYEIEELYFHGYVKSKKTNERITGICIWIKDVTAYYNESTYMDGRFSFYLPKMDNYTIIFTDVDGDENGKFRQLTLNLTREEIEARDEWIIALEEVEEEESTNDANFLDFD